MLAVVLSLAALAAAESRPTLSRARPALQLHALRGGALGPPAPPLDLQLSLMPAALGTVAIVYSNVLCMYTLNKIRYAERSGPVHPYRPWADTAKNADAHYRAYKACQNVLEWTVYSLPLLWLYVLYTPTIPRIGRALSWFGAVLGLALARFNATYAEAYAESADARVKPFYQRIRIFQILFLGFVAGAGASVARALGGLE